jgi:hypothetical protein
MTLSNNLGITQDAPSFCIYIDTKYPNPKSTEKSTREWSILRRTLAMLSTLWRGSPNCEQTNTLYAYAAHPTIFTLVFNFDTSAAK